MSSFADPKANSELLRHLADTLVEEEVVKPMTGVDWDHTTTPPRRLKEDDPLESAAPEPKKEAPVEVKTDNPAPAPAAIVTPVGDKTDDTKIDWEALRNAESGLIMNKYKTPAEAVKGVSHAVQMAKQAFTERDQALEQLANFGKNATQPVTYQSPVQTTQQVQTQLKSEPVKSEKLATVLAKISAEGGLLDNENSVELANAFSEQVATEATRIAEEKISERERAYTTQTEHWDQVANQMIVSHPDSVNFLTETSLFIKANPKVSKIVSALSTAGDDYGASEYAWTEYKRTVLDTQVETIVVPTEELQKKEIQLEAREQVRQEEVDKARKDAGVPVSSAKGVHTMPETDPSKDEVIEAVREMNATGLGHRWRALTIGKDLPDEIFSS